MAMQVGKYGFITIKEGPYKGDLGYYMEDVEPDADGNCRAHVALIEKSKVLITRLTNLEWASNQEELAKKYEASHEREEEE